MLNDKIFNELDECIKSDSYIIEVSTLCYDIDLINNLISIVKNKFTIIEVIEKDREEAIIKYKDMYIGIYTYINEYNKKIILIRCNKSEDKIHKALNNIIDNEI